MRQASVREVRDMLRRGDELLAQGWTARGIRAAVQSKELQRVRRGVYMSGEDWRGLWPESQHRAHVVAVDAAARGVGPVFAMASAMVLHGVGLACPAPARVHVAMGAVDRRSAPDVFRHEGVLPESDITEIDGIRCTTLERAVHDVARLASAEVAIVAACAALAKAGGSARSFDADAAEAARARLAERAAVCGARGIRHARSIIEIADGRAESVLEAKSLLQFRRLGFRAPRMQVRVPAQAAGRSYWLDMELDEAGAFYECDGETKYTDDAMRSGKTIERVILDEKQREDWIRGSTGRRVLRGGSREASSPVALAARLTAFGVLLPAGRTHLVLPSRPLSFGL